MSHITRQTYAVQLLDENGEPGDELLVQVTHGDRMRGELEGQKNGLPAEVKRAAMNYTAVWVWAALVRTKAYAGSYQQFKTADLYDLAPIDDGEPVGPTPADRASA